MIRSTWRRMAVAIAALPILVAAVACNGDSRSYPEDLDDDGYDLAAMQLENVDMPFPDMQLAVSDAFENEAWAQFFGAQDPLLDLDQKVIQLDAQGRIVGHLTLFSWEDPTRNLGKLLQVESHATLYRDAESASNAMALRACGLLIGDDRPLEPFDVPLVADESTGFFHESELGVLGKAVDTVVCFRTGRLVHAVVQNGLDGTQDVDRAIEMAKRKLDYVDATFDERDPPPPDAG